MAGYRVVGLRVRRYCSGSDPERRMDGWVWGGGG